MSVQEKLFAPLSHKYKYKHLNIFGKPLSVESGSSKWVHAFIRSFFLFFHLSEATTPSVMEKIGVGLFPSLSITRGLHRELQHPSCERTGCGTTSTIQVDLFVLLLITNLKCTWLLRLSLPVIFLLIDSWFGLWPFKLRSRGSSG